MMKIYVVNLVVNAKNTDVYDKVALNKFPVVIKCKDRDELKNILGQEQATDFIKNNIKSQKIFDMSQWFIREIYKDNVEEFILDVQDTNIYT